MQQKVKKVRLSKRRTTPISVQKSFPIWCPLITELTVVVYIAVIAYNTIFQFFTVHAEFLLKWRNQIHICSANASSATAMLSTGEKSYNLAF